MPQTCRGLHYPKMHISNRCVQWFKHHFKNVSSDLKQMSTTGKMEEFVGFAIGYTCAIWSPDLSGVQYSDIIHTSYGTT